MVARVKGFVCYCPELRLYWHKTTDLDHPENDIDYKFDDEWLEKAITAHLSEGDEVKAKFMAHMTGLGRVNPHKIVTFDTVTDKIDIVDPENFWPVQADDDGG